MTVLSGFSRLSDKARCEPTKPAPLGDQYARQFNPSLFVIYSLRFEDVRYLAGPSFEFSMHMHVDFALIDLRHEVSRKSTVFWKDHIFRLLPAKGLVNEAARHT
jgi:hypothetical protein